MKRQLDLKIRETVKVPSLESFNNELAQAIKDVGSRKLSYYRKADKSKLGYLFGISNYYFALKGRYPEKIDSKINFETNFDNLILELNKKNESLKEDNALRNLHNLTLEEIVNISKEIEDKYDFAYNALCEGRKQLERANKKRKSTS